MREIKPQGKVYLVGAGCGGEELLTLKALDCIKNAQVIIYDSLVDEDILLNARNDCEKIYVGKRFGKPSPLQGEINEIILNKALEGKTVVRLKGGDPFVFGRGGEEAQALEKENISYEVVPGISSCIAVPQSAGIPVTHRDTSRSFMVITARKSDGTPVDREVLEGYSRTKGTLVVLMGLNLIGYIAETLISCGLSEDTGAAVISDGCRKNQRVIRTTLKNAEKDVKENNMKSPAVIVIGDTAACDFSGEKQQQETKSILITGTATHTEKLSKELKKLGLHGKKLILSKINMSICEQELAKGIEKVENGCYTIFTSPNGVDVFFNLLKKYEIDVRKIYGTRIAAVGSGTCEKLRNYGLIPDVVPPKYTVEELAKAIAEDCRKKVGAKSAVAFRSAQGSKSLEKILTKEGFDFTDVSTYSVGADKDAIENFEKNGAEKKYSRITFSSGSGVKIFFEEMKNPQSFFSQDAKIICIGEETKKQIEKYRGLTGNMEIITADNFSCKGLAKAVKESCYEQKQKIKTEQHNEKSC